jgi:hypothetical protein
MSIQRHEHHKHESQTYLSNAQEIYGFTFDRGIYKPEGYKHQNENRERPTREHVVVVKTDVWALILSAFSLGMGFITMLAVISYTGISRGQYAEMIKNTQNSRRSFDLASKSLRMDQRAWLVPTLDPINFFVIGSPMPVVGHIVNSGKTPARHIDGWIDAEILGKTQDFQFPRHGKGVMVGKFYADVFFSNAFPIPMATVVRKRGIADDPIKVTPELIRDIQGGSVGIIVFGKLTYDDIFGIQHSTDFCNVPTQALLPMATSLPKAIERCKEYNQIDKEN